MCYSARIQHDYREYVRKFGADIDIKEFVRLYWSRQEGAKVKLAKAMDAAFARGESEDERQARTLIAQYDAAQAAALQQEVFKQRKRLADAERTLQAKPTKAAAEHKRIATDKVAWALGKLADLKRTTLIGEDARIFPGWHAPVLVSEGGRKVLRPMRYQCRPEGAPAAWDRKYPGTYNARRDNLEGFWKEQFGRRHALVVMDAFYENVSRHRVEGRELAEGEREENVVLEFQPTPPQPMLVACLWSPWRGPDGETLLSFAAITDTPPPEIAAAGHDRCVIPIRPENVDAWLNPDPRDLGASYAILDDRVRPYYEHRLAA